MLGRPRPFQALQLIQFRSRLDDFMLQLVGRGQSIPQAQNPRRSQDKSQGHKRRPLADLLDDLLRWSVVADVPFNPDHKCDRREGAGDDTQPEADQVNDVDDRKNPLS